MNGERLQSAPGLGARPASEAAAAATADDRTAPAGIPSLADFQFRQRLGEGAMGTVFKAHQISMDRLVAVKILHPDVARLPGFVERFRREAQMSGKFEHPNIVRGIAVGEEQGVHYFAMEFIDGENAKAVQQRLGPLPVGDAVRIALDVARALQHAQAKRLVHRDIKPANIMIAHDGMVKLADLGLAKAAGDSSGQTEIGRVFGTPPYMAPEQFSDAAAVDGRSDIYALGATLWALLTNQLPFRGSPLEILEQKRAGTREPARHHNPQVPAELDRVIDQMMETNPAQRFQTATEVVEALAGTGLASQRLSWIDGGGAGEPTAATETLPLALRRRRRSVARASFAIGVALILLGLAVVGGRVREWMWPEPTPTAAPVEPLSAAEPRHAERTLARALGEITAGEIPAARTVLAQGVVQYPGPTLARPLTELLRGTLVLFQVQTRDETEPVVPIWNAEGLALSAGDNYRFALALSRACYVYVFQADARPSVTRMFPNARYSATVNPLAAGQVFWLPQEATTSDLWLHLDEVAGVEHVYVIAVTVPLRDDEAVRTQLLAQPEGVRTALRDHLDTVVAGPDGAVGCFANGALQEFSFQHR